MFTLSPRQVHLDFHTSEKIPGIAADFDPEAFARTFKDAYVSSVTVFARCHHGWLYYPSKRFPEMVHPNLVNKNLLLEQVDALHKYGINAPVYITVQWDYQAAKTHPEWLIRKKSGAHEGDAFSEPGFYQSLCVNTGYYDYLEAITDEVMDTLGDKLDGLFFDIVGNRACTCAACRAEMEKRGIDYGNDSEVEKFAKFTMDRFKNKMSARVKAKNPRCSIFYNAGHVGPIVHDSNDAFTHYELESLPSGGWGYLHFPVTARYARTLGKDCLGMTGKFHTSWGDFHSLKNQAALEFECFKMLSYGFASSIGDQLEPSGRLNPATYQLIGNVYRKFAEREEWARPSKAVTEGAVVTPEDAVNGGIPDCIRGASQMLEELAVQFDIIDTEYDFSGYKLLILPEGLKITEEYAAKLESYTKSGGKLIAVSDGGLCGCDYPAFFGADYAPHNQTCDFVVANDVIGRKLYKGNEFVMQCASASLTPKPGAEVLMEASSPYFYRQGTDFCSHKYTPSSKSGYRPCVVRNGNVIVFAHRLFNEYFLYAPSWCKAMMHDAIALLLGNTMLTHNGPSTLQLSLLEQPEKSRYTLHLLTYIPVRKCTSFDIIEESTPVYNLDVTLKLPKAVRSARLVPENIPLEIKDGVLHIDKVDGYGIVELSY